MNENQTLKQIQRDMEKKRAAAEQKIAEAQREIDEINDIERRLSALIPQEPPQEQQEPQTVISTEKGLELASCFSGGGGVNGSLSGIKGLSSVGVRDEGDAS